MKTVSEIEIIKIGSEAGCIIPDEVIEKFGWNIGNDIEVETQRKNIVIKLAR